MSIPVRRRHIYQAKMHNKSLAISCITMNYTVSCIHEPLSAVEMQQQQETQVRCFLTKAYVMWVIVTGHYSNSKIRKWKKQVWFYNEFHIWTLFQLKFHLIEFRVNEGKKQDIAHSECQDGKLTKNSKQRLYLIILIFLYIFA